MCGVPARLSRNPTVVAWAPVVLLPPLLILDGALSGNDDKPGVTLLGVVAAYVGCLPLVLRARWGFLKLAPLLTAGVLLVLFALEPGNTVVLIPMVALVQLAMERDRRHTLLAGVAVIPCVVFSVLPFADDTGELVSVVLRNVAFCLLALAIGAVVRAQKEAMARAVAVREADTRRHLGEERLRIAREVHDVVAHAMVAINVQSGVAAHLIDADPEQARSALREIKATSGEALRDLRATLGVLRGDEDAAPLGPSSGLGDLDELAGALRAAGVDVRLEVEELGPVPAAVHAAGYRIVQESLTNVLRHARASRAEVLVAREGGDVRVEVTDDGVGGVGADDGSGNGLRGMAERAAALDGALESGPAPGGGWAVRARLPLGTAP
jgi:signal transduction histidine kinase